MKDFQVLDMKQYYLDRERINHREAWIEQKFSKEKCSNFKFSSRLCNFVFEPPQNHNYCVMTYQFYNLSIVTPSWNQNPK